MNFIDEKKRILIFAVLLIFLFIVLYIAVSYYGRLESIRTGNVDIFNIENINKDKVDNDDKKLSSKSNIFKNNISDEGNFNSKNNKSDYKKIIKKSKFYKNHDKRIRSNNMISSNNVGSNIQDDYYKNEVLENRNIIRDINNDGHVSNIINNENKLINNNKIVSNKIINSNSSSNLINKTEVNNVVKNNDIEKNGMLKVYDNDVDWSSKNELRIFSNPVYNFKNIVAPGSHNMYKYIVNNNEKFDVLYGLKFLEDNKDSINMKFKLKRNGEYIIGDDLNWESLNNKVINDLPLGINSYDVYLLEWKWMDGKDDTKAGFNQSDYKLNIEIKAKSHYEGE